jgi:hypothetical protein
MFQPSNLGLIPVATADLETLLRSLHRGYLSGPLSVPDLTRVGLQHCANPIMAHCRGLEPPAVRAVVVAALAERARAHESASANDELIPGHVESASTTPGRP